MSRRRHHYIPRFLLNRFASRQQGKGKKKKCWLWQISLSTDDEISTKDAAVSKAFYGSDALERSLAEREGRFAEVLRAVEGGTDCASLSEDLREFVWTLAVRGKSIREQFATLTSDFFRKAADPVHTQRIREAVRRYLPRSFQHQMVELSSLFPPDQVGLVQQAMSLPEFQHALKEQTESLLESMDVLAPLQTMAEMFSSGIDSVTAKAQQKGLANLLQMGGPAAPANFDPKWSLVQFPRAQLVLGDSCVIAVSGSGESGTLLRFSHDWEHLYVPVSPSAAIYGARTASRLSWSADQLNHASSELASTHFFASTNSSAVLALRAFLGSRSYAMDPAGLDKLVAESWAHLEL